MRFCSNVALAAFRRAESGAVAVEFAFSGLLFIAIGLAFVELVANYNHFTQIDAAGEAVIAQARRGEIRLDEHTAASAKAVLICPKLPANIDCGSLEVSLSPANDPQAPGGGRSLCGPNAAAIFSLSYPVPFLTRIWGGGSHASGRRYWSGFALRNGADSPVGAC